MVEDMFVAYYVRNVPAACRFYGEVLGLKQGESFDENWVEFDLGNATFALDGTGEQLGIAPGSSRGVSFEVDDIYDMRRRVADAGAEASEVHDMPNCLACFASDPEGNRFALHQRKR